MLRSSSARWPSATPAPNASHAMASRKMRPGCSGARPAGVSFLFTMTPTSAAYVALVDRLGRDRVRREVVLAPFTTFKIGGPADLFCEVASADELVDVVTASRALEVPVFLLGLGANILVGDRGFRGLVVRNVARHWTISD